MVAGNGLGGVISIKKELVQNDIFVDDCLSDEQSVNLLYRELMN